MFLSLSLMFAVEIKDLRTHLHTTETQHTRRGQIMGNDAKENPSDGFYWIKVDALVVELLARKTLPPK